MVVCNMTLIFGVILVTVEWENVMAMASFYYRVGDKTILASGRSLNIRRYGIIHVQVAGTFSTKLIVSRSGRCQVSLLFLCC